MLAKWYRQQGCQVCLVEEPGSDDPEKSTPVANELRRVIKDGRLARAPEVNLALFSAARRELWQRKIQPALAAGMVVVSARNYFSTLAYQGYGQGLSLQQIVQTTELFTDQRYLRPDAAVILVLPDQVRAERIAGRGQLSQPDSFESQPADFQVRVNQGYRQIAVDYGLPTVDATGPIPLVQQKIITRLGQM